MRRLLIDAKEKGYTRILTLQDDLLFHKNFLSEFYSITTRDIPVSWRLLYLGASQHNWDSMEPMEHDKKWYLPKGTADGAFAVGIHSNSYDKLIEEIDHMLMPFDSGALSVVQRNHPDECYVLYPNLVVADIRDSDLRKSRTFDGVGKLFRWDMNLYNIESVSKVSVVKLI